VGGALLVAGSYDWPIFIAVSFYIAGLVTFYILSRKTRPSA